MIKARTHFEQVAVETVKKIATPETIAKPATQTRIEPRPQTNAKR
jgi:hypothetical protein